MKKILFLLSIFLCSFSIVNAAEEISTGYCEGRGKILNKFYDRPFLTISTTYKLCRINGVKYTNIRVDREVRSYNGGNVKLGMREDYPGNRKYCVDIDYDKRILNIYQTNAEEC